MRKIATVVAALMLPVQAHALGVGEIEWNSALNQPLDAEISLFSLGSVHENDIRVKLAPYEAYEQAGIEYPSILRNLKFSVEQRSGDGFYIKVHSSDAVKEPFLDILVEIDWPSGHLMREFTVLLDLPVMSDEVAGPVSAPETSMPGAAMESPASAAENEQPSTQGQVFGESTPQQASNNLRVGMVKRGDTLWGIAESMRTDKSVSVQQVMLALLKDNPEAFYNNNINNLKAGYVLRLDNPNLITEVSKEQAAREAQRQYQNWLAAKGRNTAAASTGTSPDTAVGSGAGQNAGGPSLRLVAPDQADVGIPKSAGGTGQSRNVASMDLAALRQELDSALQTSDADRQENEQLRSRIAELEEQIGKMQRLLSLRDDALSVLQANPQEQTQQTDQSTESMTTAAATMAANATEEASTQGTDNADAADETAVQAAVKQKAESKAVNKPKPAQNQKQPAANDGGFVGTAMGYIKRTMSAAGSLLNPIALGGIVSGILLLVGGAWFLRKRKISAEDLEQSMMVEVADKQLSEDLANGTVTDLEQKEETRAVELLDSTGGENFEADIDEIDVLAEADVYLAYQRFDRAEELMREAINSEPQRLDLHFKLLEVFAASGNRDGFIEMARAIKAKGGQEDASLWSKVEAMGAKIAADDPLFSGEADSADTESPSMHSVDNEFEAGLPGGELEADFAGLDDDLMLDLGNDIAAEVTESQVADDVDHGGDADTIAGNVDDLELSADDEIQDISSANVDDVTAAEDVKADTAVDVSQAGSDKPLEFNLDELSAVDDADAVSDQKKSPAFVPDNTLDFEPNATADDLDGDMGTAAIAEDDALGLDSATDDNSDEVFAFESVESAAGTDAAEGDSELSFAAEADATATKEGDSEEAAFDFDSLATESEAVGSIDDELNDDIDWLTGVADDAIDDDAESFFSSEDEVATKLDLIRAYIDMGDKESARNILTEVVEEGNDNQKQEAEELLRQIG